jgi:predicted amidohydrolase YtcJ
MSKRTLALNRRDFLKLSPMVLGGALLACSKGEQIGGGSAVLSPSAPLPTLAPGTFPETIFVNGKVVTMDAADTIAPAVANKDGLVLQTGSDKALRTLTGPNTKVIDLRGRTLTPGLIDAHIHPQQMGFYSRMVSFLPPEIKSIQDMKRKLADVVAKTAKGNWVRGISLFQAMPEGRMPNRQDLDAVSPAHPVWIMHQGGHLGVANSMALKIANISANTPNPTGGIIERDSKGNPTGILYNIQATDLILKHIPSATAEMVRENILSPQSLLAACGVTSFQDNYVRPIDTIRTYLEMGRQGKMLLRGTIYYALERPHELGGALRIERHADKFVRFAGFKFIMDGQMAIAYCHEPHKGVKWNMPTWDSKAFKNTVRTLHDTGLQVCIHTLGDAALDLALDGYEEAMRANPRPDPRHRIEHCVLSTPKATQRIKDLGVVIGVTPTLIRLGGDFWQYLFGDKRLDRAMVTREWLKAGIPIALGADAPAMPWYTPQMTMWASMTRLTSSDKVIGPGQRLSIHEALRAHTLGAAYAAHEEKVKGSLEPGKLADLIVWAEDPYTLPLQRLYNATIDLTMVGGKIVYQKA